MMNTICRDFPEYEAIERAATAEGPVVMLAEAKLKIAKIGVDQIPFIIESSFFESESIKPRQYINAGEDGLGYRVVFRFANALKKLVSAEDPPLFDPKLDRIFIVGDRFITD